MIVVMLGGLTKCMTPNDVISVLSTIHSSHKKGSEHEIIFEDIKKNIFKLHIICNKQALSQQNLDRKCIHSWCHQLKKDSGCCLSI